MTSDDELSYRQGSPVSAKIAACADRGQPGDVRQPGQAEARRTRRPCSRFDHGPQLGAGPLQVTQLIGAPPQQPPPVGYHYPLGAGQRGEHGPAYRPGGPLAAPPGHGLADQGGEFLATPMAASFSGCPPHRDVTTCIAASQVTDSNG